MSLVEFRENIFSIVGGEAANERLLGQQSRSRESFGATGAALAATFDEARQSAEERDRKSTAEMAFQALLDQLNGQIEWLQNKIDEANDYFSEHYGEDWRITFGERILAPETLERREGESIEHYYKRLDQAFMDEMIDDEGNIKPEYMDDPELYRLARMAQDGWQLRKAEQQKEYVNEAGISDDERERRSAEVSEDADFQAREEMRQKVEHVASTRKLDEAYDAERDAEINEVNVASADNAFLNG
ncbi:hypothetical protein [uncultured Sneathiella sp.]|uniref:hypothetical protein n=1 Tax=uncultured Sneathiella sp. TaxID=879315 RepID=UPI0030EBCAB8|tara:strand:+ start:15816 stop:16550 length:735 start_codon:yes stop_codon:yes gene_type:complete